MSKLKLKWINTTGGPLILMEELLLPYWNGAKPLGEISNALTDYERACNIEDFVGLVNVSTGKALVVGDEPMQTTWFNISTQEGIIVRWNFAESEDYVKELIQTIGLNQIWEDTKLEITFKSNEIVLFDSSYSYDFLEESINIKLSSGTYLIQNLLYEPNNETSLLLHRMKKNTT